MLIHVRRVLVMLFKYTRTTRNLFNGNEDKINTIKFSELMNRIWNKKLVYTVYGRRTSWIATL